MPGITEHMFDGDTVMLGETAGRVILSEGHMDGHIAFLFDDILFSGDSLFAGGCGYLFDGPPKKMHDALARFAQLPHETRVCCAHEYTQDNLTFAWSLEPGNTSLEQRFKEVWSIRARGGATVPSTIGIELATNPFMRTDSPELRQALKKAMPETDFESSASIFAATRALKDAKHYKSGLPVPLPVPS